MEITEEMIAAAERQSKQNGKGLLPMQPFTREVWIENISAIFNAMLSAAPTPPEVDKDDAYKSAWVDGFESRQAEIDSLGAELLREKNISLIRGPRPPETIYTENAAPEPVVYLDVERDEAGKVVWFYQEINRPELPIGEYPLYTSPPSPADDELRKAAAAAVDVLGTVHTPEAAKAYMALTFALNKGKS